jgi:hypothetical protein
LGDLGLPDLVRNDWAIWGDLDLVVDEHPEHSIASSRTSRTFLKPAVFEKKPKRIFFF